MEKKAPGIKDMVPGKTKDSIGKGIKKADDFFQTTQEFIDKYRQIILANENVVTGVAFLIGAFLSWVFSPCTVSIILMLSHKILISIVIGLAILLLISTRTVPLAYIAVILISIIAGISFGVVTIAWDSNTYQVITRSICENPIKEGEFWAFMLGTASGMLFIGRRYKLF